MSPAPSPHIVLLSNHNSHSQRLARGLDERGIKLYAVLLQTGSPKPLKQGALIWARSIVSVIRRRWRFYWRNRDFYKALTNNILRTDDINSRLTLNNLKRLQPDYIIVGGGGILQPAIIGTAQCGVFNVHPALLPWVRGCGVVGHSLEQGTALGATLHYIDVGIDTGPIIKRRLLPVSYHETTLADLQGAVDGVATQLMVDVVEEIIRTGEKPSAVPQSIRHPLYRWTDAPKWHEQDELARAGRAFELFETWKACSDGASSWELPPGLMEKPV